MVLLLTFLQFAFAALASYFRFYFRLGILSEVGLRCGRTLAVALFLYDSLREFSSMVISMLLIANGRKLYPLSLNV